MSGQYIGTAGRGRGGSMALRVDSTGEVVGRGRGRAGSMAMGLDSTASLAARVRGALSSTRIMSGDTVYTLRYDSLIVRVAGARGFVAGGTIARDSGARGFGGVAGRGRGVVARNPGGSSGGYVAGWIGPAGSATVNHAVGLDAPSDRRSGVQGLESSSVETADTYLFAPGELAPSSLRVMVVHLTPTATWRGPS